MSTISFPVVRVGWAALAVVLALGGCAGDDDGPPFATGGGATPPEGPALSSPDAAITELAHRLAAGDAEGVCALFSEEGQIAFARNLQASNCTLAASQVANEIEDPAAWSGWEFDGDGLEVSGSSAWVDAYCHDSPGEPGWGELELTDDGDGWRFVSYERYPSGGSCGG